MRNHHLLSLQIRKLSTSPPQTYSEIQRRRKTLEHRIITALSSCYTLTQLKQTHAYVIATGLSQFSYVITKLVRTLTKHNVPMKTYPTLIFRHVANPNAFLWAAMIRGWVIEGDVREAVRVYGSMRKDGISPVSFAFSAIFKGCVRVSEVNLGRQIHAQTVMIGGFNADLYVGNTLIDMYLKCGEIGSGRKVFDEMSVRDLVSWTEMISAYAKNGDMVSARELFEGLEVKDMVAWTAMVTGYAQNSMAREALDCFEGMWKAGVGIDEVTLLGIVSSCAQLGACRYGDWVRGVAEECGFVAEENVLVGSALVDMYAKCGSLDDAYGVFRGMKKRNVFTYSSMISGFAVHGNANAAIELFHEMLTTDVRPNRVTFVGVLTACSHTGMVDQGRQLFATMEKYYNVVPSAEHYTCMVDLFGRAGRLEEALELAETMPLDPHGGVWGALLGACRIHKNPHIAKIAASHLFELEPDNIGNYVMLSNIYASAGRWDDVSLARKLMKQKGMKKNPAYSWIETKNGGVKKFSAGDTSHPEYNNIKKALEDLVNRLQNHGYQPNLNLVDYDVDNQEKMRILMAHSEKLALAYALLYAEPGSKIKIIKNIRICEDCHAFMCAASAATTRHLIVRDNMRFHHFENGKCNCGHFW